MHTPYTNEGFLHRVEQFSVPPVVVLKLLARELTAHSPVHKCAEEIALDKSLAAKVLKCANAPCYGYTGRVKTIKEAIEFLGFDKIRNIILALSVFELLNSRYGTASPLMEDFFIHSISSAFGAQLVSETIGLPETGDAFVAGLLHDIGKIIYQGNEVQKITSLANAKYLTIELAEKEMFGITHGMAGKLLLEQWRVPAEITEAVYHHHSPDVALFVTGNGYLIARIINLIDMISHRLKNGADISKSAEWLNAHQLEEINLHRVELTDIGFKMMDATKLLLESIDAFYAVHKQGAVDQSDASTPEPGTLHNRLPRKDLICEDRQNKNNFCEFEQIYEHVPIGSFVINADKTIIKFNQEACKTFGYRADEIINKPLTALIPERYKNFHARAFGSVMGRTEHTSKTYEFIGLRKNGTEFPVELSYCLIQSGSEQFMVVTARDISHRKTIESALKERTDVLQQYLKLHNQWLSETEQKYTSLFEASKTAVLYLREDATCVDLNSVAESLLSGDRTAIVGKPLVQVMPENEQNKQADIIQKIVRDVISFTSEKTFQGSIISSKGYEIPVEFNFRKLENNADRQVICMVKDISMTKQIEEQVIKAQKFESLGALVGGMVHNLKNIMASITGYVSLLKTLVPADEKLSRYLEIVETSCNRATDMTREMLTAGRKQDTEKRVHNANRAIERSIELFEQCIDAQYTVQQDLDPSLYHAEFNESHIEQVLLNLLINARDAMPHGGKILVKTQNIYLNNEGCRDYHNVTGGNFIEVSVADHGVGIPRDVQERIFDPFFSTKEEDRGTGLGLSTVDRIVKNHRGFVEVYSREGEGATFKVYLPALESAKLDMRTDTAMQGMKRGAETILAVDDENNIIRMISDSLGALGYTIISASNGREAVKVFEAKKAEIDLIILDLMMPSMNGYEAFKEIKEIDPNTKIILCTGYVADDNIQKMLNNGVRGLLKKPYRIEDLYRAVRLVLDEQPTATAYFQ